MSSNIKPYFMWSLPLVFFAFQFVLRLWPGLNMQHYLVHFSIDASAFGLFSACYYYGYASMQIPLAMFLANYPVNRVVGFSALLCALAMMVMVQTSVFYVALMCRFLIGVGSAVGFLAISSVLMTWFKPERYAQLVGLSFSFGLLGAIYGGKPVALLIHQFSSQTVGGGLALVSLVISLLVLTCLKTKPPSTESLQSTITYPMVKALLASRQLWLLALANLLMVGALEGFADVWGVPYLMLAYSFKQADAALLCSFVFIGMLFGGPVLASLSRYIGYYGVLVGCGLGLALAFSILLTNTLTTYTSLAGLFFVVGLLCCYQVIVFATGQTLVATPLLGICVAFLNSINMLGGSFFHTAIGKLMDFFWEGTTGIHGVKVYSIATYQCALSLIPVCAVLGVVCLLKQRMVAKSVAGLTPA